MELPKGQKLPKSESKGVNGLSVHHLIQKDESEQSTSLFQLVQKHR